MNPPTAYREIVGINGWPYTSAIPSLGPAGLVSIFIVVVLPQPFEPRPKISPRSIAKLTRSTAVNVPKRGQVLATMTGACVDAWRDDQLLASRCRRVEAR